MRENHRLIDRTVSQIALRGVRFELREYVPYSGEDHTANSDNGFLVTATSLYSTVTFLEFRVFVGFNNSVSELNQERFEINTSARDTSRLRFSTAFVIARTAASPRAEVLRRRKNRHIGTNFRDNSDSGYRIGGKAGSGTKKTQRMGIGYSEAMSSTLEKRN